MTTPLVSIIMSTHNEPEKIEEAIKSVLRQSYGNFEFLIVCDCASENTIRYLSAVCDSDKRISLHINPQKLGLSSSLNKGISLANGKYIARIDDDDLWIDSEKLKKQIGFMETNPDYDLVGTWASSATEKGENLPPIHYPRGNAQIKNYLLLENCFIHSSVLIRRTVLKENVYDEKYLYAQDYDLWLRLGKKSMLYNIPEVCVMYKKNSEGMSQTHYRYQILESMRTVQKHRHYYPHSNIGLTCWRIRLLLPRKIREYISYKIRGYFIKNI